MKAPARGVREQTGDVREERRQQRDDQIVRALASSEPELGTLLKGEPQTDGSVTYGILFTTGQTREVPHGLGRKAQGFRIEGARVSAPLLYMSDPTSGFENTHIKLTHTGASSTRVILRVW